jgi:SAM-dependent methyltransferase
VFSHVALPEQGRVLDYGCGNGALLRSFHELKPGWNISGADIGGHFKEEILSISEGAKFYNVANEKIDAKFDMISLLHCLEHLVDGRDILQDLSGKLSENGILFIQVPNAAVNPFDLLIYDHIFHFTPDTLSEKLKRAGFERVCILSSADEKEISMVAGPGVPDELLREGENQHADDGLELFRANISFLEKCEKKFLSLKSDNRKLGIFGTSIAGTWLSASCNGIHDFFVDEDVERTGRKYHDRDVLLPDNVPEHAVVFVPLPPKIATKVMDRLDSERLVYCSIDQ